MSVVSDCYLALERLVKGDPKRLRPGYKINLNTVAKEAGHIPSSIKASRESHKALHRDVYDAAAKQQTALAKSNQKLGKQKQKYLNCEGKLHASYNREILLAHRIHELERRLKI